MCLIPLKIHENLTEDRRPKPSLSRSTYVEVFILTEIDTVTDVNGFQTHFIGLCLCQCERTMRHRAHVTLHTC